MHNRNAYRTILIYMRKHSQYNNDERTLFFRKIYLTLYSKWLRKGYVWEVSWRLNKLQHIDPSSFVFSSTSFLFCWAAQSGVLRAHSPLLSAGSLYSILSPTNWLQLIEHVCRTGLYNCLTSTCFLQASHLHLIRPVHSQGYTLIFSTGCTCYLHRCISYLTAQLRVNMLYKIIKWCLIVFIT